MWEPAFCCGFPSIFLRRARNTNDANQKATKNFFKYPHPGLQPHDAVALSPNIDLQAVRLSGIQYNFPVRELNLLMQAITGKREIVAPISELQAWTKSANCQESPTAEYRLQSPGLANVILFFTIAPVSFRTS
jgi:hypothetical protein